MQPLAETYLVLELNNVDTTSRCVDDRKSLRCSSCLSMSHRSSQPDDEPMRFCHGEHCAVSGPCTGIVTLPRFRRVEAGKSHLSEVGRDDRSAPNDPRLVDQEVTGNWQRENIKQTPLCCTVWYDTGLFQTHVAHFSRFSLIGPGRYGTSAAFPA